MSHLSDKEFKRHAKRTVKEMARQSGPVELPDDLALDDRIVHVSFKTKKVPVKKVTTDKDRKERNDIEEALRTMKRDTKEKAFVQQEERFSIVDNRTHLKDHGGIPTDITGDEFNGMSEVRRKMLLRHPAFNSIVVRNLTGTESVVQILAIFESMSLLQKEARVEADSTIVSFIVDNGLGFYKCFIFPNTDEPYFSFYYSCDCECRDKMIGE